MTADSALFWVLAHRGRVAQFRRSIAGTRVEAPFKRLLRLIRAEASSLERPAPRRKARRPHARRRQPAPAMLLPPFLV